jgi:hypothetical protein
MSALQLNLRRPLFALSVLVALVGACGGDDEVASTEQAATVHHDESYVVMGRRSVSIAAKARIRSGNVGVAFGSAQYPGSDGCVVLSIGGERDESACFLGGYPLVVGRDVTASGSSFFADTALIDRNATLGELHYRTRQILRPGATIASTHVVDERYFPLFPNLPTPPALEPGVLEPAGPLTQVTTNTCLQPGTYGALRVRMGVTLTLAADCTRPGRLDEEGNFTVRAVRLDRGARLNVARGDHRFGEIRTTHEAQVAFAGGTVRASGVVLGRDVELVTAAGTFHFGELNAQLVDWRFFGDDVRADVVVSRIRLGAGSMVNAFAPGSTDPTSALDNDVRIFVQGRDGTGTESSGPVTPYAAAFGAQTKIVASVYALTGDDSLGSTIDLGTESVVIGALFGEHVLVRGNADLTNANRLVGPGSGDTSYRAGDADNDGRLDGSDNCQTTPNPTQTDQDGDGYGDACDNCPTVANPRQEAVDGASLGAACTSPPGSYCGDGIVDPGNAEVCDDGFASHGLDAPCDVDCALNAPRITAQPRDASVDEGADATFFVTAVGHELEVQWSIDGEPIVGATSATLVLSAVELSRDGAEVRCVVSNPVGSVTSDVARLSVRQVAPQIVVAPSDVTTLEGGDARFEVTASGSGLRYQWLQNGEALIGATNAVLDVANVRLEDDGSTFRVVVSNDAGSVTSPAALLFVRLAPPRIVAEPSDQIVLEGEAVAFLANAEGSLVSLQWLRDGVAIPEALDATYVLDSARLIDDGARFSLRATNEAGSVTSREATLSVLLAPPRLQSTLVDQTVQEGATASFTVAVEGSLLAYEWFLDGARVEAAGSTLALPNVPFARDGARVSVRVSNAAGRVESEARLYVRANAPVIVTGPVDLTVDEGQAATFGVAATGSALSYAWRRDGVPIAAATSATLTLPRVEMADDGARFSVVVSNEAGTVESATARLAVRRLPPRIVASPSDVSVLEGEDATFTLVAEGSALSYQWFDEVGAIAGATGPTLTLSSVDVEDDGRRFRARVSNDAGEVFSDFAALDVALRAPVIVAHPVDTTVVEGAEATFAATASGTALSYQWLRNGAPIVGATDSTLVLSEVRLDEGGDAFALRVTNAAGSATSLYATLSVSLAPPRIVASPSDVTAGEGDEATFVVDARGSALAYQWRRNGAPLAGGTAATLSVVADYAFDGDVFDVVVSNTSGSVTSAAATLRVTLAPPRITTDPSDASVDEGSEATFEVAASGTLLSYRWLRDGVYVDDAFGPTLTLSTTELSDDGSVFEAEVSNASGTVRSAGARLTVRQLAPGVTTEPADTTVDEGSTARFEVSASGSGLSYQWEREGAGAVAGATSAALEVSTAYADDGARFRCVVSNGGGSATTRWAALTVRVVAPVLESALSDVTVQEGEDAVFVSNVRGSALSYAWTRDGVAVTGATGPTLTVPSVAVSDDGAVFAVVASNAAGSVTTSARLRVNANAPVVETGPADATVSEGATATFTVSARGTGLTYAWSRDGVTIPGATSASYVLSGARYPEDDGAQLTVEVRNTAGAVTAGPATLRVTQAAPTLTTGPSAQRVTEGESASFTVVAAGSVLTYAWEREVAGAWVAVGGNAATLTVADAQVSDAGRYRVVVSNGAGSVTSDAVSLTVDLAAPRVTSGPSDASVREGEAASFTVVAQGTDVTYQWLRNGVAVEGATSVSYTLSSAALTDDGARFAVRLTNAGGSVTSDEATLSVTLAPPSITVGPEAQTVEEGEAVTFTVSATGSRLAFQWSRDGVDLPGATAETLTLPETTLADDGAFFSVRVSNDAGSDLSSSVRLTVTRAPPAIVTAPSATRVPEGTDASFSVVARGTGLSYQWLRDGAAIVGATGATLVVPAVRLADDGARFSVTISNAAGSVTSVAELLSVELAPPVIEVAPSDADLLEGDDVRFEVEARGSLLRYQWLRNGAPVAGETNAMLALSEVSLLDDGVTFAVTVSNDAGSVTSSPATLVVRRAPPRIVTSPNDLTVDEGEPASFEVVAEGTGLAYQWRRDGVAIPGATLATYALAETSLSDDGAHFDVLVRNDARPEGVVSAAATLTVRALAPRIVAAPTDVLADEGAEARFSVVADGSALSYAWLRDGAPIDGATGPDLVLANVSAADDGARFSVRVSNAAGSVTSSTATLSVRLLAPTIETAPSDLTVDEGAAASFAVVARGTALSYRWFRDGVVVADATEATLTLSTTELSDDGSVFEAEVSNASGTVRSTGARLTVRQLAPVVTTEPSDTTVDEGSTARFEVSASGSGLSYQWEREGAGAVAGATSAALEVSTAYADDGARFRCVVSNGGGSATTRWARLTVRVVAPVLDAPLSDATVQEGEDAVFVSNVRGSALSYAWTRDGVTVAGATGPTLSVPSVAVGDDGAVFAVVASNAAGSVTTSARLRVNANAPVVETGPADATVAEGASATFTVSARGTGLTYAWSRDGEVIVGATSASYVLSGARYPEDDGAQLTVEVRNAAGAVTAGPATLRVTQAAPTLTTGPSAQRVTEGETASFTVVAAGSVLTYAWEREVAGAWVAVGGNAATLTVADAQVSDAGRYRVVVSNGAGSVTSDAVSLTVDLAAPRVTNGPSDASVREGEAASFTVVAQGTDVTYQWLRNGVAVEGATSASYTLSSAALTDDGARFAVRLTNAGGSVTSDEATLSVTLAPPSITTEPTSVEVDEGASAAFSVVASGSQLSYRWQRDGVDLPVTTATLTLASASLADAGEYRAVVSNAAGSVTSAVATLTVRRLPPRIVTQPSSQTVDDGSPAYFAVVAEGSDLSFHWFDAGGPLAGETENMLSLSTTLADDGRSFHVVVSNAAGDVTSAAATLTVRPRPPVLTSEPADVTVLEGGLARFELAASGSEPLAIQWFEDDTPIDGATSTFFELPSAPYASSGRRYAARVSNAGGEVRTRDALLTVQLAPPRVISGPESQSVLEGADVRLEVVAEGSGLTYAWRKDGGEVIGSDAVLDLGAVGPDAAGVYAVVVANAAGTVERTAVLDVSLAAPTIAEEPADVAVGEGAGASFAVVATGSSLSYQWQRDGADVEGATSPTLALATTRLLDDGASFRVRVSNAGGEVWSRTARLSVAPAPPVISAQPSSVTVTEGESGSLVVVAVGAGLSYLWHRDGAAIPGATDATLTFANATLSDAGTYYCLVSNATGSVASAQASVTVRLVPPVITAEPSDVEVAAGGAVTLTVAASGRDLSYQWLRLGAPIAGATSPSHTFDASYADDGVTFSARVSNSGGSVLSRAALVRVRDEIAPALTVDGAATRTTEDPTVRLTGTASDEGVGLASVVVTTSTVPEGVGATLTPTGAFEVEVPLAVGENALTVVARDRAGNATERVVTVTQTLPLVPRIAFTEPSLGFRTTEAQVRVAGRVYTQLEASQVRLLLGELVAFPTATDVDGVYAFRFDNVPLRLGSNVLTVQVQTPFGAVSAQTVVARDADADGDAGTPTGSAPRIALPFAGSHLYLDSDVIPVRGTVTDDRCVESVSVAGVPVALVGAGAEVGFSTTLSFGGATSLPIRIEARDCDGNLGELRFTAHLDDAAPVVTVTGLPLAPTVHPVMRTPYPVSGTVRDANVASFTIAGAHVSLLPTADPAVWTFASNVAVTRGGERRIVFEARDRAGRAGRAEILLRLDAELDLELVTPLEGDRLVARGDTVDVPVRARIAGLAPTDTVVATLDGGMERALAISNGTFATSFTGITNGAEHSVVVTARASDGRTLATASARFELVDESTLPLELVRMTPTRGANGVEANQFVSLLFNRPVDPTRLRVEVRETVHGEVYAPPAEGADLTNATRVDRVYVDRSLEPVPGHVTNLPGGSLIAFYPSRDYGYGGEVQVEAFYDDESVARGSFRVRPIPTLVTGFVADHDGRPLPNVEVELPRLGLRLRTDREGAFELGWGWAADRVIPPGEHLVIVNPEGRDPTFGTLERRVTVRAGQTNLLGQLRLPWLDPSEPRRLLVTGERNALMSGDLVIDLSDATFAPTVVEPVAVHAQLMETRRLGHPFSWSAVPDWAFVLSPTRLDVVGDVRVELRFPLFRGSHDYVDGLPDHGILFGLDPETLRLVPVGVGQIDRATRTVRAIGATHFRRLDVIGFGRARDALLPSLEAYARGELSIVELAHRLETTP